MTVQNDISPALATLQAKLARVQAFYDAKRVNTPKSNEIRAFFSAVDCGVQSDVIGRAWYAACPQVALLGRRRLQIDDAAELWTRFDTAPHGSPYGSQWQPFGVRLDAAPVSRTDDADLLSTWRGELRSRPWRIRTRSGIVAQDFVCVPGFAVEIDDTPDESKRFDTEGAIVCALAADLGAAPFCVVYSGSKSLHAFWRFSRPVWLSKESHWARYSDKLRKLCAAIGADGAAIDVGREFRTPAYVDDARAQPCLLYSPQSTIDAAAWGALCDRLYRERVGEPAAQQAVRVSTSTRQPDDVPEWAREHIARKVDDIGLVDCGRHAAIIGAAYYAGSIYRECGVSSGDMPDALAADIRAAAEQAGVLRRYARRFDAMLRTAFAKGYTQATPKRHAVITADGLAPLLPRSRERAQDTAAPELRHGTAVDFDSTAEQAQDASFDSTDGTAQGTAPERVDSAAKRAQDASFDFAVDSAASFDSPELRHGTASAVLAVDDAAVDFAADLAVDSASAELAQDASFDSAAAVEGAAELAQDASAVDFDTAPEPAQAEPNLTPENRSAVNCSEGATRAAQGSPYDGLAAAMPRAKVDSLADLRAMIDKRCRCAPLSTYAQAHLDQAAVEIAIEAAQGTARAPLPSAAADLAALDRLLDLLISAADAARDKLTRDRMGDLQQDVWQMLPHGAYDAAYALADAAAWAVDFDSTAEQAQDASFDSTAERPSFDSAALAFEGAAHPAQAEPNLTPENRSAVESGETADDTDAPEQDATRTADDAAQDTDGTAADDAAQDADGLHSVDAWLRNYPGCEVRVALGESTAYGWQCSPSQDWAAVNWLQLPCRTGKTQACIRMLASWAAAHPAGRIVWIVARRSLALQAARALQSVEALADFGCYLAEDGSSIRTDLDAQSTARIVITVDSLHRLAAHPAPELVVIDEWTEALQSLALKTQAGERGARLIDSLRVLQSWAADTASSVRMWLCCDALAQPRAVDALREILQPDGLRAAPMRVFCLPSTVAPFADKRIATIAEADLPAHILQDLTDGRSTIVYTRTRTGAQRLYVYATRCCAALGLPQSAAAVYTADTPLQDDIGDDAAGAWHSKRIVIYNGTISSGVSYPGRHFDRVYSCLGEWGMRVEDDTVAAGKREQIQAAMRARGAGELVFVLPGKGARVQQRSGQQRTIDALQQQARLQSTAKLAQAELAAVPASAAVYPLAVDSREAMLCALLRGAMQDAIEADKVDSNGSQAIEQILRYLGDLGAVGCELAAPSMPRSARDRLAMLLRSVDCSDALARSVDAARALGEIELHDAIDSLCLGARGADPAALVSRRRSTLAAQGYTAEPRARRPYALGLLCAHCCGYRSQLLRSLLAELAPEGRYNPLKPGYALARVGYVLRLMTIIDPHARRHIAQSVDVTATAVTARPDPPERVEVDLTALMQDPDAFARINEARTAAGLQPVTTAQAAASELSRALREIIGDAWQMLGRDKRRATRDHVRCAIDYAALGELAAEIEPTIRGRILHARVDAVEVSTVQMLTATAAAAVRLSARLTAIDAVLAAECGTDADFDSQDTAPPTPEQVDAACEAAGLYRIPIDSVILPPTPERDKPLRIVLLPDSPAIDLWRRPGARDLPESLRSPSRVNSADGIAQRLHYALQDRWADPARPRDAALLTLCHSAAECILALLPRTAAIDDRDPGHLVWREWQGIIRGLRHMRDHVLTDAQACAQILDRSRQPDAPAVDLRQRQQRSNEDE